MPHETEDASTPAWAKIDLQGEYELTRIVLFPRNDHADNYGECFPVDFQLQVSATGEENAWETVKSFEGVAKPTEPFSADIAGSPKASYVRLYVTKRTGEDNLSGGGGGNDGKLVQLSEMAVFGRVVRSAAKLNKTALELKLGSSERVGLTLTEGVPTLSWTSDDSSIAAVSQDGTITAKGVGSTTVRASGEGFAEQTVSVSVVEKKYDFDENITLSVFWLPTKTYLNGGEGDERWDEQFKLLQDADIDWLAHVTDNENTGMLLTSKEDNLKAAQYAAKYGMHLTVADTRFGQNLLHMTEEEIVALIEEYRNIPGVGGYYLWDEPGPDVNFERVDFTSSYAQVYAAMKKTDPDAYTHLNFLPMFAYADNETAYRNHISAWLDATEKEGVAQDYIMYDFYPYTGFGTDMDREHFFSNLDAMRKIGLDYGVKTATYLQSNGGPSKRSPSPAEIRYQAMVSLAYGYKQLSYFTWFLPTNRGGESFQGSIVNDQGVPNPNTYEAVSKLNREIHSLGKTLAGLDSLEVYLNGKQYGGQLPVPEAFPLLSMDNTEYTVSLLKDKKTGRNYVMLVNNDFTRSMQTSVYLNYGIRSLAQVSPVDGTLKGVDVPSDGILTISLEAGDAVLYALPEGMDYTAEQLTDKTQANAILTRASAERGTLSAADVALLDAATEELRAAMQDVHTTQARLDALTERVKDILDNAQRLPDDPAPPSGGTDDPAPPPKEEKKGCGGVIGGTLGGACAAGLLLLALLLIKKKRRE